MDGGRVRSLIASALLVGGVLTVAVGPVAGATCTLDAPASVAIGSTLTIRGSGYPANTAVDVSITVKGGTPDEFTAQSDAAGEFTLSLTPEAADAGSTTVVASAGAGCSAQVVIAVGTTTGENVPEPGGDAAAGAGAPRTDTVLAALAVRSDPTRSLWLGLILVAAGLGGLLLTRSPHRR